MPFPNFEKKKYKPSSRQVTEATGCSHEGAYRAQPRQLTRQECKDQGLPYGTAETQWLCPKCPGVFWGEERPEPQQKADEYDYD